MIVALIALFVALGGGAYAATTLPRNSVGTAQLKDGAVTARKLHNGAFTAEKIAYGSLLAKDFKAGQLPSGATGAAGTPGGQGPKGDTGAQGPTGPSGSGGGSPGPTGPTGPTGGVGSLKVEVAPAPLTGEAGETVNATATCVHGTITGGGYSPESGELELLASEAVGETAWRVSGKVKAKAAGKVQAVCARVE